MIMEITPLDFLMALALFWLVFRLGRFTVLNELSQFLAEEDQPLSAIPKLIIDLDQGQWFAYREDGSFVAYGQDMVTMFRRVSERFPQQTWHVDQDRLCELTGLDIATIQAQVRQGLEG